METIQTYFAIFNNAWQQADWVFLLLFGLFFLAVWFLPSLLALLLNRRHAGKIALLNVPAGFSVIAWVALCVWAVTGKLGDKLAAKAKLAPVAE
ncbi:Superinfection immunity protein [Arsukibacterium tuosuense]|uniref:Superinfection immunity protein n=1 Tax=Arsukibacterium tuosuense TaxID=1323745 RepID=A0A285IMN5_9GAMM|nr:superinfection immunity protein [Arsukibacterium tuosuense]SNY49143.1 Superinfection immunity protein [Arsukibacterium tuosuense]